jgi:sodium transport system permease protein
MSGPSLLGGALVVLRKELKDNLRDRRSLTSGLLVPLLGPVMFTLMFTALADMTRRDKPLEVAVRGQENAPSLVAFLERNGATVKAAPEDAEGLVRDGKLDLALLISPGYGKDFSAGRTATVELVLDSSSNKARTSVRRVQHLLQGYGAQLGALRLLARGVSPALASPVKVEELDLATPERTAASVLGMVPMFLLMAVFVGSMYVAIDATAGERERGSLEPLLLNPVTRAQVVLGKWVAVVVISWFAVAVSSGGFMAALRVVPLQDLGVRSQLGLPELLGMIAVALPLTLFAGGLQMLLALFSRTFKEAQTYLSLLMVIPMLPAMLITLSPMEPKTWMMTIPAFSQTLLLNGLLRGEPIPLAWQLLSAGSALVGAALAVAGAVWLIGQEKIVFGRGAGTS